MPQFGNAVCVVLFSLTWFSVSGLQLFNESVGVSDGSCPPWLQPSNTSAGEPSCVCPVDNWRDILTCDDVHQQSFLHIRFCMTYVNSTVYLAKCSYVYEGINDSSYITLPRNVSELNTFFCDSQNRKGYLCSECKEDFGISVLSNSYRCEDCRKTSHGVLRYLALQFIPLAVFFFFILLTQISITKPPMSTFVLYCQFGTLVFSASSGDTSTIILLKDNGGTALWRFILTLLTMNDIWNLDFGTRVFPPFCVSPGITCLQSLALKYVSAFYSLVLIVLTYTLIELHGRDFRPLVWLWRPFHKCFAVFRRNWNPRASVIDVFATFFLLSYTKLLFTSLYLFQSNQLFNVTVYPPVKLKVLTQVDPNIRLFGSGFIVYAVLALLVLVVVAFLPVLLVGNLMSRCCSCHVCSSRCCQLLHMFIEKFNGYYKDGTGNEKHDYRWVSLQPFALRIVIIVVSNQIYLPFPLIYFTRGLIFFGMALFTAIIQPYKQQYMNIMDVLLMANLGILSLLLTALSYLVPLPSGGFSVLCTIFVLIGSIPHVILALYVVFKLLGIVRRFVSTQRSINVDVEENDSEDNARVHLLPDSPINSSDYEPLLNVSNSSVESSKYASI